MLRLFNSLGKKMQTFRPVNPEVVNIFTCGPSVYQRAHIGNFRTFLFEDVVVKYLEFSGFRVKRGMIFTDIEDKAVAEARKGNTSLQGLTDKNIRNFMQESALLKIRRPDYLPRATRSIGEAVRIIETLLKKGKAYWHKSDVYFDPLKFTGFGKIYGLDMARWPKTRRRFRRDTYPGMRWNLGDFILWHGCRGKDIECWDSRIGPGRPAWNIQDASAVNRYFSESLSIYCGGIDNLVRHHDYTLAILESVRPYPMSRFWLHCRHLFVNGRKMSKSLGNIVYTDDLLNQGCSAAEIRFFLIYNHYQERINYTERNIQGAALVLKALRTSADEILKRAGRRPPADSKSAIQIRKTFSVEMDDDLNVKNACEALLAHLTDIVNRDISAAEAAAVLKALREIDRVLGVLF